MEKDSQLLKKINPVLTIWFPLFATIILIVAVVVFLMTSNPSNLNWQQWSNISLIVLSSIFFVMATMELAILIVFILITSKLASRIPSAFNKVNDYTRQGFESARSLANLSVKPIIQVQKVAAGIKSLIPFISKKNEMIK